MKILYIDISLQGHRSVYLNAFAKHFADDVIQCFCMLPEYERNLEMFQIQMKSGFDKKRTINTYYKFLKEIRGVIKKYHIDIVHFLCGDALYKFMGIGFFIIPSKIIITYHHMVFPLLKTIAIKNLFKHSSYGIVHTDSLQQQLLQKNIENVKCIFYPMLDQVSQKNTENAKLYFSLPTDSIVLGVIGGTQLYKGLDFLLTALNHIQYSCTLFICGVERDFKKDYIEKSLTNPKVKLHLFLRGLSDEEFADAVQASDYIVLPYRKEFDGASGPLVSAAMHKKPVIAANHGSLGDIVSRYHLGTCFESENADNLAEILNQVISKNRLLFESVDTDNFCRQSNVDTFINAHKAMYEEVMRQNHM